MKKEIFMPSPLEHIKKERQKARQLRKSPWWKQKIQKGSCYHCQKDFSPKDLTMDHLVPLVRGGKTGRNNVVPSCQKCNSEKSFKTLVELKLQKS